MWVEMILSKLQRKQIMESSYNDPTAGHLGRTQTFSKVSEQFYWAGIFNDVEKMVCKLYNYNDNHITLKSDMRLIYNILTSPHNVGDVM